MRARNKPHGMEALSSQLIASPAAGSSFTSCGHPETRKLHCIFIMIGLNIKIKKHFYILCRDDGFIWSECDLCFWPSLFLFSPFLPVNATSTLNHIILSNPRRWTTWIKTPEYLLLEIQLGTAVAVAFCGRCSRSWAALAFCCLPTEAFNSSFMEISRVTEAEGGTMGDICGRELNIINYATLHGSPF